jgi:hypothetical protein
VKLEKFKENFDVSNHRVRALRLFLTLVRSRRHRSNWHRINSDSLICLRDFLHECRLLELFIEEGSEFQILGS